MNSMSKNKIIYEFSVYYSGWECDDIAWVMQSPDGRTFLKMTDHGREIVRNYDFLEEKIKEYKEAIKNTERAISLLKGANAR